MMKEKKTADAIHQRGRWIRVGMMFFYMRPVTFGQKIDLDVPCSTIQALSPNVQADDLYSLVFSNVSNYEAFIDVATIVLMRSQWKRRLLRWYVKRHLTDAIYRKIEAFLAENIDPLFFYASTTFLRGMMAESTDTIHGQSYQPAEDITE